MDLVLASSSPRRLMLLKEIGVVPVQVFNPQIDETPMNWERASQTALRLAVQKAQAFVDQHLENKRYVLAADTVVSIGWRALPITEDREMAERCLRKLSGRWHWVITGMALFQGQSLVAKQQVKTRVKFGKISRDFLDTYLEGDEWRGRAGGYALIGQADGILREVHGSLTNVFGLPVYDTLALLRGHSSKQRSGNGMK